MKIEALTIGLDAGQASVHVETTRYYQRLGLVPEPVRPLAASGATTNG